MIGAGACAEFDTRSWRVWAQLPPSINSTCVTYVFSYSCAARSLILLCVVAASSDFSVRMLIKLGQKVNKKHYEQLVQSQFGKAGYIAVSAAMGIFAYGAMCAYLIGIGDTMSIVFAAITGVDLVASPWIKRVVLTAIAVGAVLPLALLKNMAALTKTSLISICSVLFITFVVVVRLFSAPPDMLLPVGPQTELKFIDVRPMPPVAAERLEPPPPPPPPQPPPPHTLTIHPKTWHTSNSAG